VKSRVFLFCLLALFFAACRKTETPASRPLTISAPYEVVSLDPHVRNWLSQFAILFNFYEPLVTLDQNMTIRPGLARQWENPDLYTWVFHLQRDALFHDGKALTAEDVVATVERLLKDRDLGLSTYLTDVSEVKALDQFTVKFRTRNPLPIFLNKLYFVRIVRKGSTPESLAKNVNGTGPYRLLQYTPGEMVRMVRNE
jgi:peptide/nickel transport system substrate-binding protein